MWLLAFRALSAAPTSLPEDGIGAVAEQLAASVDVRLNAKVDAVREGSIDVNGETLQLTESSSRSTGPLAEAPPDITPVQARASTCVYFSLDAKDLPTELPIILLIPDDGPLNNVCFPSNVQSSYAPEGRALCSATIIDATTDVPDDVEAAARKPPHGTVSGRERRKLDLRAPLPRTLRPAPTATGQA